MPPLLVLGLLAEGVDPDDVADWSFDEPTQTFGVRLKCKIDTVLMTVKVE
jgi:hypothetical protein